jgi:membrane protease YdiL (CAAX protease family)
MMKTAAILVFVAIFGGILLLTSISWTYTIASYLTRRKLPLEVGKGEGCPSNRGGVDILVNFLIYAVLSQASIQALYLAGLVSPPSATATEITIRPVQFLVIGAAQLAAVLLGSAFVCFRAGVTAAQVGWDLRSWQKDLAFASYGFGLIIVPVFAVQALLSQVIEYEHPAITPFKTSKSWLFFAAASFSAVIVAPIAEEFFFRGILQSWLQRIGLVGARTFSDLFAPPASPTMVAPPLVDTSAEKVESLPAEVDPANPYGFSTRVLEPIPRTTEVLMAPGLVPHWPIWVTSAIFALLHAGQGAAPVPLFLFSVMLGYVYRKTGRLLPVIAMHMLLNGVSMIGLALSAVVQPK